MEEITNNYGFQHISEKIFKCLDKKDLMNCRLVNKSFKKVLGTSAFWFKKLDSEVPDLVTRSWKSCCQIYKAWKMLSQNVEKIDTRLEEFVLLLIKFYKSQQIELIHPLDIAAKVLQVSASRQSILGLGRLGREADLRVTSLKLLPR